MPPAPPDWRAPTLLEQIVKKYHVEAPAVRSARNIPMAIDSIVRARVSAEPRWNYEQHLRHLLDMDKALKEAYRNS